VLEKLREKFAQHSKETAVEPHLALAYIDLENANPADEFQQPEASQQQQPDVRVPSEVDWSDFNNHEQKDIFTAIVNSLKQNHPDKTMHTTTSITSHY
jgi:hypothetical protein